MWSRAIGYAICAWAMTAPLSWALAASIRSVDVSREGAQYRIHYLAHLDVTPSVARRYLTDLEGLTRLSDRVRESRLLDPATDGKPRLRLVMEVCGLLICRSTTRTAQVEVGDRLIVMRSEPAQSDFALAHEHWGLRDDDGQTLLEYEGRFIPKFWIPPLIDSWLIETYIRRELEVTCQSIETLARREAATLP